MSRSRRAFSLIELVIVIVIMGVISAIAIPRVMKGAEGADVTGAQSDLAVLRSAIEMYRYEHSAFPAVADLAAALTKRTDKDGTINAAAGAYGPYLVKMPAAKVGPNKGDATVVTAGGTVPPVATVAGGNGWIYDEGTGGVWVNDVDNIDL